MLRVHHQNASRAWKTVWLHEKLEAPYELVNYLLDPVFLVVPPSCKALRTVAKSPMIEDDCRDSIESGAINNAAEADLAQVLAYTEGVLETGHSGLARATEMRKAAQ